MENYDVVVVGAGMVGLTLALALKDSGLRVAVIDKGSAPAELGVAPELQVSALTLPSVNILKNIGAWQALDHARVTAYTEMQVWDQDSFASIDFECQQTSADCLGVMLENLNVRRALQCQIEQCAQISLLFTRQIQSIAWGKQEAFITLDDDTHLSCRLVVGADGPQSMVKQKAQFPQTFWDYDQQAIVATIRTDEPHRGIARQVFTPAGPLAFLPMWDSNLSSIVWSQDTECAEQLSLLSQSDFEKALTVAFDNTLGQCSLQGEHKVYPLTMRYARQWLDERVVLVGDAAHTIHPLAGQGANLGLVDAAALAERIIACQQAGKDFGLVRHLRPYERWRKTEAAKMVALMQGFKTLFADSTAPKKLFRGLGLAAFNAIPMTKQAIVQHMLGESGTLPKLAQHGE